jgi:hypothetical protein
MLVSTRERREFAQHIAARSGSPYDEVGLKNGAAGGIRTPDPRITNAVLYQLSYCGI